MQKFYKPKMLRQIAGHSMMLAYPDGLPGGWNKERKVHFIAHSQGTITCRYLQYLLSIDYFGGQYKEGSFQYSNMASIPRPPTSQCQDNSDFIASITCINGALNGSIGPYTTDLCEKTLKYHERGSVHSNWLQDGYIKLQKIIVILQNLGSPYLTKDRIQENIVKVIKMKEKN